MISTEKSANHCVYYSRRKKQKLFKAVQSITNRVFRINFMNIETCDAVVSKKKCKEII